MKKGRAFPAWTALRENHFKTAVAAAMEAKPLLCHDFKDAIERTAARRGVHPELREQFLRWIGDVEAALAAMAEADRHQLQPKPGKSEPVGTGA